MSCEEACNEFSSDRSGVFKEPEVETSLEDLKLNNFAILLGMLSQTASLNKSSVMRWHENVLNI